MMSRTLVIQERLIIKINKNKDEINFKHQIIVHPDFGFVNLARILIPRDFKEQIIEDGLLVDSQIVALSSHTRDLYNGHKRNDSVHMKSSRADALRAEFLRAKVKQAEKDNTYLRLSLATADLMDTYPDGIRSLPKGYWYKTTPLTMH